MDQSLEENSPNQGRTGRLPRFSTTGAGNHGIHTGASANGGLLDRQILGNDQAGGGAAGKGDRTG